MTKRTLLYLCFASALAASLGAQAQEKSKLSEVQILKGDSYVQRRTSLAARFEYEKAQALEAISKKYQQELQSLETERLALEADYRKTLGCALDAAINWQTKTCEDKSAKSKSVSEKETK